VEHKKVEKSWPVGFTSMTKHPWSGLRKAATADASQKGKKIWKKIERPAIPKGFCQKKPEKATSRNAES